MRVWSEKCKHRKGDIGIAGDEFGRGSVERVRNVVPPRGWRSGTGVLTGRGG